jgi:hypothetical protein
MMPFVIPAKPCKAEREPGSRVFAFLLPSSVIPAKA